MRDVVVRAAFCKACVKEIFKANFAYVPVDMFGRGHERGRGPGCWRCGQQDVTAFAPVTLNARTEDGLTYELVRFPGVLIDMRLGWGEDPRPGAFETDEVLLYRRWSEEEDE